MKKSEQIAINNDILNAIETFKNVVKNDEQKITRLRTMNAYIIEDNRYISLISYRTCIAFIDKTNNTCYDFLRYVYGYTATSAKHVNAFYHDCNAKTILTYRYI